MKLFLCILIGWVCIPGSLLAQDKKKMDHNAIQSMCGCYEVTFEYAETFSPDTSYQFHDRKTSRGLEWILADEIGDNSIVIQHLLVLGNGMVIKHWREDWIYENQDLYTFVKDNLWQYEQLKPEPVKGQWTQKVYQVDDSPRYEGTATWIHADGKHYWESEVDAPLPRREYTQRNDYNVMRRINRHQIRDYGHVHDQDNRKILRTEAGDQLIAMEKGMNTYRKVDDSHCKAAQDWWAQSRVFWKDVRIAWEEVYKQKKDLVLLKKVEGQPLWRHLFALGQEANEEGNYQAGMFLGEIKKTIQLFMQ